MIQDWRKTDKRNEKKLLKFAEDGNAKEVDILLSIGINPNCQAVNGTLWERGRTPLHWAVINHYIDVITLLLKADADPDVPDMQSETALFKAINHKEMAKILLENQISKVSSTS